MRISSQQWYGLCHGPLLGGSYWKTTDGKSAEQVITNIDSNILERPLTMEISESTANGMAGYFYDEYQMAKEARHPVRRYSYRSSLSRTT